MLARDPLRFVVAASLLMAAQVFGTGCWLTYAQDAEIGCGVNAQVNPKCPNRPMAPDAAYDATMDAAHDAGRELALDANDDAALEANAEMIPEATDDAVQDAHADRDVDSSPGNR
jgi:hypothetical protein